MQNEESKIDWQGVVALSSPSRPITSVLVWRRPVKGAPWSKAFSDMRKPACAWLCKLLKTDKIVVIDLENLFERQRLGLHVEVTRAIDGTFDGGYLKNFTNFSLLADCVNVPEHELLDLMQSTVSQGDVSFDVRLIFQNWISTVPAAVEVPKLGAAAIQRLRRFNAQMTVAQFAHWLQVPEKDVLNWESPSNALGEQAPEGAAARLLEVLGRSSISVLS